MINNFKFFCPYCKKENYQKIIFLNHDFQFQCLHCEAFHIFHYQTLSTNNSLYIGTFKDKWIVKNFDYCRSDLDFINTKISLCYFESLIFDFQRQFKLSNHDTSIVKKNKISSKIYNKQKIFIANASPNKHFQECLRGVIRMKEHLLETDSKNYYNILIKNEKTNLALSPLSKLEGIDELWEVQSSQIYNYFSEKANHQSLDLSLELSHYMQKFNSQTQCVSKQAGPTRYGSKLIKDLFEIQKQKPLYSICDNKRTILGNKHVAITIRNDNLNDRAGFDDPIEIHNLYYLIKEKGFNPIVLACAENETNICSNLKNLKILIATSLEDQVLFYSRYCYGMVGTNGSCCNIPSLYNIPMFILARSRPYPDDFYCFGRLISPYVENHPYHGELWKADNIWEYKLSMQERTSIEKYKNEFNDWLYTVGKNILCKE